MIRRVAAVVIALHGIAHTVGFVATFQLGDYTGKDVDTTLLWGRLDIGLPAAQAMGIGWLLLAAAFVMSAVLIWRRARRSIAILGLVTAVSLVFSVLASPAAIVGVGVNVAILLGLAAYEVVPARATPSRSGSNTGPSIPIG